jgi:hypothetical protein
MRAKLLASCLALALIAPVVASADRWKDNSGHRHWDRAERWHDRGWDRERRGWRGGPPHHAPPHHARGGIPPGHLPPPGHCRDCIPGVPPGHQPPPYRC